MRTTDELDRLVLDAVGDDFVTLEFIVDKLASPGGRINGKLDPGLLHSRLLELIADKLINAYLLHADPPYITPVNTNSASFTTSWFYITQRGRKCLANSQRRAAVPSDDADSPDQGQYNSAVNF